MTVSVEKVKDTGDLVDLRRKLLAALHPSSVFDEPRYHFDFFWVTYTEAPHDELKQVMITLKGNHPVVVFVENYADYPSEELVAKIRLVLL